MSYSDEHAEPFEVSSDCSTSLSNDATKSDELTDPSIESNVIDSSIWKKIQYLLSTLKDVQMNLSEMGVLMVENDQATALKPQLLEPYNEKHSLDVCIESPKTDEAKLNEILDLLHHIANTLSTYEQNPILLGSPLSNEANFEGTNLCEQEPNEDSKHLEFDRKDYYCIARNTCDSTLNSSIHSNFNNPLDHKLSTVCTQTEGSLGNKANNTEFSNQENSPENIDYLTKHPNQSTNHAFSSQTKSLRKEIDDIIQRKEALDDRLQYFFKQKESGSKKHVSYPPHLTEEIFEDSQDKDFKSGKKNKKHRHRDKKNKHKNDSNHILRDLCPAKPLIDNGDKIEELRLEEESFLGSADNGLSSEINSLSLTIQELVKENQHFYSFFQGISAQDSLQNDKPLLKAVALPECHDDVPPHETFNSQEIIIESNAMLGRSTSISDPANVDLCDSSLTKNTDISHNKLSPTTKVAENVDKTFDKELTYSHEEGNEPFLNDQLSIDQLANSMPYENKSQNFSECSTDSRKTSFDKKFTDEADSLLNHKKDSLTSLKNLASGSRPQIVDGSNKLLKSITAANIVEPHKTCLSHIEKLVGQNQSLQRQLFLVKSQLRKSSYPGALNQTNKSLVHQTFVDGMLGTCSTPISDPGQYSDPSKEYLISETEDNSCLDEELETLKSKVVFLENFMKNEANNCAAVSSINGSHDNSRKDCENQSSYQHAEGSQDSELASSIASEVVQNPNDKSFLHKRIQLLMQEKQSLTNRLEELMVISQELAYHFKNTKEELTNVTLERNLLHNNLIKFSQESIASSDHEYQQVHLEQQVRTRELENELEKAWRLVHERTLERDKFASENAKLEQSFESTTNQLKQENASISVSNAALRKESALLSTEFAQMKSDCSSKEDEIQFLKYQIKKFESKAGGIQATDDGNTSNNDKEKANVFMTEENLNKAGKEWQNSVDWLQKCLAEEKLHGRLLEAAEHESIARVALLQQALKETGSMYTELQTKYQKLRKALQSKKSEKYKHRQVLKDCRGRVEELKMTTSALEDTYKVMLSTLGQNIGIAVDLLSSHLYLSPGSVHPSPELSDDPTFWFAAQCSRLRWLQAHLKKLGLNAWKGTGLRDSSISIFESSKEEVSPKKTLSSDNSRSKSFDSPEQPKTSKGPTKQLSAPASLYSKHSGKIDQPPTVTRDPLHPKSKLLESNIWATLNDVEINLTNQQIQLFENKSKQINHLVALLDNEAIMPNKEDSSRASSSSCQFVPGSGNSISDSEKSNAIPISKENSLSEIPTTLESSSKSELDRTEAASSLQSNSEAETDSTLKSSLEPSTGLSKK